MLQLHPACYDQEAGQLSPAVQRNTVALHCRLQATVCTDNTLYLINATFRGFRPHAFCVRDPVDPHQPQTGTQMHVPKKRLNVLQQPNRYLSCLSQLYDPSRVLLVPVSDRPCSFSEVTDNISFDCL